MSGEAVKEVFTTVVFPRKGTTILLAMKKRGFGVGRWNGAGGKIEPGETSEASARRETLEEIGINVLQLMKCAEMTFHELHDGVPSKVYSDIYTCDAWTGEPTESEEMAPKWFQINNLPLSDMWPDDAFWLPRVLAGEKLRCAFTFDNQGVITHHTIQPVEEL